MTYVDVAKACEDAGASWVTLHARTIEQGYSGDARWEHIARLVGAVGVPVVGNGDLRTAEDVLRMREATGCAGFFIARAAMRDPTVFARMRRGLATGDPGPEPTLAERMALARRYMERAVQVGITNPPDLRRQVMRFASGQPGAKRLRVAVQDVASADDILRVLDQAAAGELAATLAAA
jgi:tRNA-dihydrouridine synthase B